jgi:hypothetical protein
VKEEYGCYRFLGKPNWVWDIPHHSSRPYVEGIEDSDWELTVSPTDHNEYRDTDKLNPQLHMAQTLEIPRA